MLLSRQQAQQQLAREVKWWRRNFSNHNACTARAGWSSYKGNSPTNCDSIFDYDYNHVGNAWCGTSGNKHKKRTETKKTVDESNYTIFKESDRSLSGGRGTAHFIESWSGTQFIWHFKLQAPVIATETAEATE
jgi:hypothetical protein